MLLMPVCEVSIFSLTLLQEKGEGLLTGSVLKIIVPALFLQEWAPNHYSLCASTPPTLTTVHIYSSSFYYGGAEKDMKTPTGDQPCSKAYPRCCHSHMSASWQKMPFSVRHQNQNSDLYDNFESVVYVPGRCS